MAATPLPVLPPVSTARLLNSDGRHWQVGRALLVLVGLAIAALFLPWQQNVQGTGVVTALRPEDRPQQVPALIAGRIARWHVAEGAFVRRGQLLVTLAEVRESFLDPQLVERTGEQVAGKVEAVAAKRDKVAALGRQLEALNQGLALSLQKGRNKVALEQAAVEAAILDSTVAARQLERNRQLFDDGLRSRADLEAYQLKAQATWARLVEQRRELDNARIELASIEADYNEKAAKVASERSGTLAEVGEGAADVARLRTTQAALRLRREMYEVVAPQDGYVVRAVRSGVGEWVKEGEPIVTVMPASPQHAVELYVRAMDVPLLRPGRKVRLQFDGWPALQFSGWPSVSVGTFGGEVRVIDRVNAPDGSYRILVVADSTDEPWPGELRVGSGVLGWTMLDEVRLGFEIWRRLNGFPPSVATAGAGSAGVVEKK